MTVRRTTTLVLALGSLVLAACGGADSSPHAAASGTTAVTSVDTDHAPCAVSGRPDLVAHIVEGLAVSGHASRFTSTYHRPVLLTPTARALVQLVWPSVCFATSGRASASVT
jgi:hypothetical protein